MEDTASKKAYIEKKLNNTNLVEKQVAQVIKLFVTYGYEEIFRFEDSGLFIDLDKIPGEDERFMNILNEYIMYI